MAADDPGAGMRRLLNPRPPVGAATGGSEFGRGALLLQAGPEAGPPTGRGSARHPPVPCRVLPLLPACPVRALGFACVSIAADRGQYSLASMMVRMRRVTLGSAGSGESPV